MADPELVKRVEEGLRSLSDVIYRNKVDRVRSWVDKIVDSGSVRREDLEQLMWMEEMAIRGLRAENEERRSRVGRSF